MVYNTYVPETSCYQKVGNADDQTTDIDLGRQVLGIQCIRNCPNLLSVNAQAEEISVLGPYAFAGNSQLTELRFKNWHVIDSNSMFNNCAKLSAIELPDDLYEIGVMMFNGCQSLKNVKIPASTRRLGYEAFSRCKSLSEVDTNQISAGELYGMFDSCENLTAVSMPNYVAEGQELQYMFNDCYNVKKVSMPKTLASVLDKAILEGQMFGSGFVSYDRDVSVLCKDDQTGDIVQKIAHCDANSRYWQIELANAICDDPVAITLLSGQASLNYAGTTNAQFMHSRDGRRWFSSNSWNGQLNVGDTVYIAGKYGTVASTLKGSILSVHSISDTSLPAIKIAGNMMSLLDATCQTTELIDNRLIEVMPGWIEDASELNLAATSLCPFAYRNLFQNSRSTLKSAPTRLPAIELANACYYSMFARCYNLTSMPELPATELADGCYQRMFSGCKSLSSIKPLSATKLANNCYNYMFAGCTNLSSAVKLEASQLCAHCYDGMFSSCTSLTAAPELPATELAVGCYQSMFSECYSLKQVQDELPATKLCSDCYNNMYYWSGLTAAPYLPATNLAEYCYSEMFGYCKSLSIVQDELPATDLTEGCYFYMFAGTAVSTTIGLPAVELAPYCYNGMYAECYELQTASLTAAQNIKEGAYDEMFVECPKLSSLSVALTSWTDGSAEQLSGTTDWLRFYDEVQELERIAYCPSVLDTSIRDEHHIPEHWTIRTLPTT